MKSLCWKKCNKRKGNPNLCVFLFSCLTLSFSFLGVWCVWWKERRNGVKWENNQPRVSDKRIDHIAVVIHVLRIMTMKWGCDRKKQWWRIRSQGSCDSAGIFPRESDSQHTSSYWGFPVHHSFPQHQHNPKHTVPFTRCLISLLSFLAPCYVSSHVQTYHPSFYDQHSFLIYPFLLSEWPVDVPPLACSSLSLLFSFHPHPCCGHESTIWNHKAGHEGWLVRKKGGSDWVTDWMRWRREKAKD